MVHLWILQKAKGQFSSLCFDLYVLNNKVPLNVGGGSSSGAEEALQPHHWRDVSLHVAPSEDKQQNLLHRRTGQAHVCPKYVYEHESCHSGTGELKAAGVFNLSDGNSSPGVPPPAGVSLLRQQQKGWLLPQRQHPRQVQVLRYKYSIYLSLFVLSPLITAGCIHVDE